MLRGLVHAGLAVLVVGAGGRGVTVLQAQAPMVIAGLGEGAVPIEGGWEFHTGDNLAWAAPGFDDSAWQRLSAGQPWGRQGHAGYHGFAWYRKHLDLRAAPGERPDFRLLLPDVDQAYEVYWNGVLVGRCGALPPHPVWYFDQGPHAFPLAGSPVGVLAVRVWNAPPLSDEDPTGGLVTTPLVGTPKPIANAHAALDFFWLRSHQFVFTENLVFGLVALFSFLAWLRNREQWLLLWMTGFTLSPVISLLLLHTRIPIPYTVAMSLDQPVITLRDVSLWFLLLWLLELHGDGRLTRLTQVLALASVAGNALDGVLVAVAWHPRLLRPAQTGDALITAVNTVLEMYPMALIVLAAARRKRLDAANMAVAVSAFVLEMVYVVRDVAGQGKRFTHWTLSGRIDNPIVTLNGSAVSLADALEVLLFLCMVWAVYRSFFKERKRQLEVEQELRNARELQRVLVPDTGFDFKGFQIGSAYVPAAEVGGDFFQVLPVGEAAMVVVGDVSGKGLKAAMAVSFLVGTVRAVAGPVSGPSELLSALNRQIVGRLRGGFTTCLALEVRRDGRCRVASAGHPGPFIDGLELELEGALPLGLLEDLEYAEAGFTIQPGQTCALYTDGLLEARNRAGDLYGYSRLAKLFAGRPSAEEAAQAAVDFGQDDDITVLTITRVSGRGVTEAAPLDAGEAAVAG